MGEATSQSNSGNPSNSEGGSGAGTQGGEGNQNPGGTQNGGQQQQQQGQQQSNSNSVDLTKLTPEQLNQVFENPALWQTPRFKELAANSKELKTLKENQAKADEQSLADNKKWEELANKRGEENETLKKQNQDLILNSQLTSKLLPLGVVDMDAALALIDRSKIEIAEDGSVKGVDEAIESLKTGKAYLFNGQAGTQNPPTTVGGGTNPGNGSGGQGGPGSFTRSQIADPKFYQENRAEILKAQAEGRIVDDITPGAK